MVKDSLSCFKMRLSALITLCTSLFSFRFLCSVIVFLPDWHRICTAAFYPAGQRGIVITLALKAQAFGHKPLALDIRCRELFSCHAVVLHKAHSPERNCAEDAEPRHRSRAECAAQAEVDSDRDGDCQYRKNELTQVQPKEDTLLILSYLSIDFDFHVCFFTSMKKAPERSDAVLDFFVLLCGELIGRSLHISGQNVLNNELYLIVCIPRLSQYHAIV